MYEYFSGWGEGVGRSVALSITLHLKVGFKARDFFVKNQSTFGCRFGRGVDVECPYARIDDFRGGATNWTPSIGDSVLRENWTASPGPANRRAETLRHRSALPARNHSACASTRFYTD